MRESPSVKNRVLRFILVPGLLAAAVLGFFLGRRFFLRPLRSGEKPPIILIAADSLRAQQLPAYGYSRIRTPRLDRLAADNVLFKNCFVLAPATLISFSSLFTGRWDAQPRPRFPQKTLAQHLGENGYRTAAIISSNALLSAGGAQHEQYRLGFEEYQGDLALRNPPYFIPGGKTTESALRWLDARGKEAKPFFLFVHYEDPHSPYEPNYDGEIEKIDREVGRIIAKLKELSLYDRALLVFTSDHGESLGDHASPPGHSWFVYTEQVRVPLVVKFPGSRFDKTVDQVVRSIDIMPTVLDYLGVRYDRGGLDGRSLLPAIRRGKNLGLVSYHMSGGNRICPEGMEGVAFGEGRKIYHFLRGRYTNQIRELYDHTGDPGETRNLYADPKFRTIVSRAGGLLDEIRKRRDASAPENRNSSRRRTGTELRALQSLGYLAGGAPAPDDIDGPISMTLKWASEPSLSYARVIRRRDWGMGFKDQAFPVKIVTADNRNFFIIADRKQKLFRYSEGDRFQSLEIQGVEDIAVNSMGKMLYYIQGSELKIFPLAAGAPAVEKTRLRVLSPCRGIHGGRDGFLYILKDRNILRVSPDGIVRKDFPLRAANSNEFAADAHGRLFLIEEGIIRRFDPDGRWTMDFGKSHIRRDISAIAPDEMGRIWALKRDSATVILFDPRGNWLGSRLYNDYTNDKDPPSPTKQIFLYADSVYIMDNWEGILAYRMK